MSKHLTDRVHTHTHTLSIHLIYFLCCTVNKPFMTYRNRHLSFCPFFIRTWIILVCKCLHFIKKSQSTSKYFLQATAKYDDHSSRTTQLFSSNQELRILTCISWVCKSGMTWLPDTQTCSCHRLSVCIYWWVEYPRAFVCYDLCKCSRQHNLSRASVTIQLTLPSLGPPTSLYGSADTFTSLTQSDA